MLTAIIVAAGSSRRMGSDKVFAPLLDRPVIAHTMAAFDQAGVVTEIVVVARKEQHDELRKLAPGKVAAIVEGGDQRQDSVAAGLLHVGPKAHYVAVHDAARPLVTPAMIERIFAKAQETGAAAAAEPVADTLKRADGDLMVRESVDRHHVFAMQTPQIFEREVLANAYRAAFAANLHVTDEVSAVQHFGRAVTLVPSEDFNFKITYPRDLVLAGMILRHRAEM